MLELTLTNFQEGLAQDIYAPSGWGRIQGGSTNLPGLFRQNQGLAETTVQSGAGSMVGADITALLDAGAIYGLGINLGAPTYPNIYKYDSNTWTGLAQFANTGSRADVLAVYQGNFYGLFRGTHVWRGSVTGTPVPDFHQPLAYTFYAPPVVHNVGKTLYFFTDNKVSQQRDATFTSSVLTFETDFIITSACEYGNYLLICGYNSGNQIATAAIWDRDSSLGRITQITSIGKGIPTHCAVLDGIPTVIMSEPDTLNGVSVTNLVVRQIAGAYFKTINRIPFAFFTARNTATTAFDNRLFFGVNYQLPNSDDARTAGVMSVDSRGNVYIEYINSFTATGGQLPFAIAKAGPYLSGQFFTACANNSTFATNGGYSSPSILETKAIRDKNPANYLKLSVCSVTTKGTGTITIKGRKETETAWTTLHTSTDQFVHTVTANMVRANSIDFGRTRVQQLRVEGTGGVEITGIYARFEQPDKEAYE